MVVLNLSVAGETQIQRDLIRWAENVVDARPAFEEMSQILRRSFKRQFTSEGGYGPSGRWAPLSPDYAKMKRRVKPSAKILVFNGTLEKDLTTGARFPIQRFTANSMTVGTASSGAGYHQRGTSRMPARRIVDLRPDVKREMVKALQAHLQASQ